MTEMFVSLLWFGSIAARTRWAEWLEWENSQLWACIR